MLSLSLIVYILLPIFVTDSLIIPYSFKPFDICIKYPVLWFYMKVIYLITYAYSSGVLANFIHSRLFKSVKKVKTASISSVSPKGLHLYVGINPETNENFYIPERGLYQNILITGTIGSGKTSSAMYPFTRQLMKYGYQTDSKIGMLILDVKGNYRAQIKKYAEEFERSSDFIVIELKGNVRYNPLDKPDLKPIVLANRLKTILTLFSPNTSDSYWLDKAEQVLAECIKLCRLYNKGYVTFVEIHKLINTSEYYKEKLVLLRSLFQSGQMSVEDVYNLHSSISFFETEFLQLDPRVLSIIKSEITRITNTFISDFDVLSTFCPEKEEINFFGFKEVIKSHKIVLLNMNIAEYKILSKIIAAYLKLDFQSEVLSQLGNNGSPNVSSFISDEYAEYVTDTDADFFSQSREARCINIVATQSYTSLLNALKNESSVKVIIQNLINKLWFQTSDSFTFEEIQKQLGKEDKEKTSKSISENANETHFHYLTNSLGSKKSNVSESISTYIHSDYIYDTNFFTQKLETFSCLAFLSDGFKIISPSKIKMMPYFSDTTTTSNKKKKNYKII